VPNAALSVEIDHCAWSSTFVVGAESTFASLVSWFVAFEAPSRSMILRPALSDPNGGGQILGQDWIPVFLASIKHCELAGRWGGRINFGVSLLSHLFSMNLVIALLAQVFQTRVSTMLVRDLEAQEVRPNGLE